MPRKRKADEVEELFASVVMDIVEQRYCLGGASCEEVHLAMYDFFSRLANDAIDNVPFGTQLPPLR